MTGQHHHARGSLARVLSLEIALLEAEVNLLEQLIAAGIMPPGARREPTGPELRAGVRFAELDRIVNEAAALITRKTDRVRDTVLDGLAEQLASIATEADPYRALAELDRLTDPTSPDTIPGLRAAIDDAADAIREDLIATARAGSAEALEEARRQGLPDRLIPDVDPVDETVEAAATAHAARVAKAPADRLLDVAAQAGGRAATRPGATGGDVMAAALDGAEDASRAGTEDLARQAANVTHGLGRAAAQAALPAPAEVYASELLDANTCGPCAVVDGRTYRSLADGLVDYPGAGGYVACDGGARCRGTLVLVHDTEAPPTLDNPGQGPRPAPTDRTPQGPSGDGRPAHIDADGNLIPTAPDEGTAPTTLTLATVDDTGRTVIPLDDLEPPIATVPPESVERDPDLAESSDDELIALIEDPAVGLERQLAAADEYDRRQAGEVTRVYREEELDPETLARYEAEREAWEAAGGDVVASVVGDVSAPGGRRIDRVKAYWTEHVEQEHIRAEYATNGYLVARERMAEFQAKFGGDTGVLFEGPARVAYYYASRELRDHWDTLPEGRLTFSEFAVSQGITDRKTRDRARTAAEAREDARNRADESAAGRERRKRQRAEKARRRGPLTAGERLARDQARRDRIRAAERKRDAEIRRAGGTTDEEA